MTATLEAKDVLRGEVGNSASASYWLLPKTAVAVTEVSGTVPVKTVDFRDFGSPSLTSVAEAGLEPARE